jgi:hypothetical protein
MKTAILLITAAAFVLLPVLAFGQTKTVLKNVSGNTITESLTIGSGKTLTIAAGATINATGATITGFGSGGGSPAWGDITGTLASQTDLNTALGLKAPLASPTFTGTVTIPSGASISGYATTAAVASGYQPLDGNLTGIAAAASAAGVLTDNGSSSYSYTATSTGGNGSADSGKIPKLNARGGLNLGGSAGSGNVLEVISSTSSFAIEATNSTSGGTAIHATPNGTSVSSFGTHLTAASQIAFEIDGSLGTSSSTGIFSYMPGPALIAADDNFAEQVSIWGTGRKVRFTAESARAASYIDLTSATPTGARTITLPDASGTVSLLGSSIDLTTEVTGILPPANMGTGSSISTKYLRGDGTWQAISGGGDALTSGTLAQFAATTSAQLRGVLSDENGTGEFLTTNGSAASLTSFPTLNQSTTGNAATATALQTGRTINGTTFDGTANITVTAAAGTLTGTTLASGVTASSLTSLGTIATGVWQGTAIADSYISSASTWNAKEAALTFSTGLTRSTNTITVNTSQNIATLSNLTTNGILTTTGSAGTLTVDTTTKPKAEAAEIGVAISDETTAITTGTAKITFRMPFSLTVTAVRLSLTTVSSSGTPTVDINEAGTTILSTKLSCDASEKTSTTAATAAVISDSALADDAEITIDVDTAGTGATGAKVWIIGTR